MKTYIIKADGSQETREHEKKLTLEEMQTIVGGYIELTTCSYEGKIRQLVVNEDGGPKDLPRNLAASRLFTGIGYIVGDVFIPLDWKLS